jgi:hypothetical protein
MEKKNGASIIRLTGMFREAQEVHLDAPSALKIRGRFKNATSVTLRAIGAFFYFLPDSQFCGLWGGFQHSH